MVDPAHFGLGQPLISANLNSSIALGTSMGFSGDGYSDLGNPCSRRKPGENILRAYPGPPAGLRQTEQEGVWRVG